MIVAQERCGGDSKSNRLLFESTNLQFKSGGMETDRYHSPCGLQDRFDNTLIWILGILLRLLLCTAL